MDFASQAVIVKGLFVKSRNCFGVTVNLLHQSTNRHPLANTFVVGDLHTPLMPPRMDDRRHTVALSGGTASTSRQHAVDKPVRRDAILRVVGEYGHVFDSGCIFNSGHSGLSIGSIWKSVKFFLS